MPEISVSSLASSTTESLVFVLGLWRIGNKKIEAQLFALKTGGRSTARGLGWAQPTTTGAQKVRYDKGSKICRIPSRR